jgi:hypothetical protein
MTFCSLYGPLSSLWSSVHSTDLHTLYCFLSLLRPTVLSTALCLLCSHLYTYKSLCLRDGPLSPLQYSVPSMALCPLYSHLSPLRPSIPSRVLCLFTALCPLYCHMSLLQLFSPLSSSVPSEALCPLYGPLSPLQPSVPSMAFCSLYGPLFPLLPSEKQQNKRTTPLVLQNVLQNSKGYRDLFCISDNQDYHNNHDYH